MPSKNLLTLNNGWPFSDKPLSKGFRFDVRDGRLFMTCAGCPQAIMALTDQDPEAVDGGDKGYSGYLVTLQILKERIADHWLRCHEQEIAAETYC